MKAYQVSFKISILDKATSYPEVRHIDLSILENLPPNTQPEQYLRKRLAEELRRAFAALPVPSPIDNFDDSAPASEGDL